MERLPISSIVRSVCMVVVTLIVLLVCTPIPPTSACIEPTPGTPSMPSSSDWTAEIRKYYTDQHNFITDMKLNDDGTGHWNKGNALLWTSWYYIARKLRGEWCSNNLQEFHNTVRKALYNPSRDPGRFVRHPECELQRYVAQ
jgi:hypothetical protein